MTRRSTIVVMRHVPIILLSLFAAALCALALFQPGAADPRSSFDPSGARATAPTPTRMPGYPAPAGTARPVAPFVLRSDVAHPAWSPSTVREVLRGLRAFSIFTRETLRTPLRQTTTVTIATRADCYGVSHAGIGGFAQRHSICLFADTANAHNAAHEAAHVLLNTELGCKRADVPQTDPPRQVIEGMAEDVAYRATHPRAGMATLRRLAAHRTAQDRAADRTFSYGLAAELVLRLEQGRPRRLVSFCRAVGGGTRWDTAMMRTLGR